MKAKSVILVTGSTGYIGSRLVPRLLADELPLRAMVRDANRLGRVPWAGQVQVVEADVLRPESLPAALTGVHTAYYLIHSMLAGEDFHHKDLQAARDFGRAAARAGVQRIIYLGALGDPGTALSPHLESRQQTAEVLREAGVPVTEFRAAVVVGAGSLSFEMVRYLTEHVPLMICPRWVYSRIQPIAIRNVLDYLAGALSVRESIGAILEIGGDEILTYGDMMTRYATIRSLRRALLPVPLLTPRLSSLWVDLVTPISAAIARPLIEGVRNEVIVRDPAALRLFPEIQLLDYAAAVRAALAELNPESTDPIFSAPIPRQGARRVELEWKNGLILERRSCQAASTPEQLFRVVSGLGGARGWLYMDWAWRLRGAIDRLLGGVGMRRGRRTEGPLQPGDPVDFWTVEAAQPNRLLRLKAETRLPGEAWLEFAMFSEPSGGSTLLQRTIYAPKGLLGLAYWYLFYPLHSTVFAGLLRRLVELADSARLDPTRGQEVENAIS